MISFFLSLLSAELKRGIFLSWCTLYSNLKRSLALWYDPFSPSTKKSYYSCGQVTKDRTIKSLDIRHGCPYYSFVSLRSSQRFWSCWAIIWIVLYMIEFSAIFDRLYLLILVFKRVSVFLKKNALSKIFGESLNPAIYDL